MDKNKVIFNSGKPDDKRLARRGIKQKPLEEKRRMNVLSEEAQILLDQYQKILEKERKGSAEPNVEVSQVLAPVAFLYERVRNAIDYKGEHLLKRNAIERILRRQIWERPQRGVGKHANHLVRELIWARYIKNDTVPKSSIEKTALVIEKYLKVIELVTLNSRGSKGPKKKSELRAWFFGVASCEIEEIIDPTVSYSEVLNYPVYLWFKKHFDWQDEGLSEKDKDVQIMIAVHRSLPKSDEPRIRYHLLNTFYPKWMEIGDREAEKNIENIIKIVNRIERYLDSPVQARIYRFVQKQAAAFHILKEVIEENIEESQELLRDSKILDGKIRLICERRYDEIRQKVKRGTTRSVIYIFTTKVLLAFLIEIPYELIFLGVLNYVALLINTIFPPALMFMVGLTIKRPDEANTKRIIQKVRSFVYKKEHDKKVKFSLASSDRTSLTYRIFLSVYSGLFLLIFGGITYVLFQLEFNLISGVIFFAFLSLVLLFGYRVRFTASELNVMGEQEGFFSHLLSNVTLPFLNLGVWLSQGLSKLNFLIVIMDFLIETPLKSIIAVFEEWTMFIKEKREEVVEVPV